MHITFYLVVLQIKRVDTVLGVACSKSNSSRTMSKKNILYLEIFIVLYVTVGFFVCVFVSLFWVVLVAFFLLKLQRSTQSEALEKPPALDC